MRNLRSTLAVLAVAAAPLAACSKSNNSTADAPVIVIADAAPDAPPPIDAPPDAPNYDFTCLGNTAPTSGANNVLIAGLAEEASIMGLTPMLAAAVGANIDTCKAGAPNCTGVNKLNTTTSITAGAYSTALLPTGGMPLDAYLAVTNQGDHNSYEFSAKPFTATAEVPIFLFSTGLDLILAVGNDNHALNPADGFMFVVVQDCAGARVADATLSIKQGDTEVGNTKSGSMIGPMGAGGFLSFDIPPGETVVSASYMGMDFLPRTVTSFAGGVTEVAIRPGY